MIRFVLGASIVALVAIAGARSETSDPSFDNDGTLWSEKPVPFQLLFAFDQVKALAPQHPEWKTRDPFASLLKGHLEGVA